MLNEKKARAVVGYSGEEYALEGKDTLKEKKQLQGIFALVWEEYESGDAIHFLWVDCNNKICRNICMDSYGYNPDEVMELFANMFAVMSKGILQLAREKLPVLELFQYDNFTDSDN